MSRVTLEIDFPIQNPARRGEWKGPELQSRGRVVDRLASPFASLRSVFVRESKLLCASFVRTYRPHSRTSIAS